MSDTFRRTQRPLSEVEKKHIEHIKREAEVLLALMDDAISPLERSERSRCMNIARTNLEQAIMWGVKGITTDVYQ